MTVVRRLGEVMFCCESVWDPKLMERIHHASCVVGRAETTFKLTGGAMTIEDAMKYFTDPKKCRVKDPEEVSAVLRALYRHASSCEREKGRSEMLTELIAEARRLRPMRVDHFRNQVQVVFNNESIDDSNSSAFASLMRVMCARDDFESQMGAGELMKSTSDAVYAAGAYYTKCRCEDFKGFLIRHQDALVHCDRCGGVRHATPAVGG